MKQIKQVCIVLSAIILCYSCNDSKTTTTDNTSDSITAGNNAGGDGGTTSGTELNPPMNLLVIEHKVSNYDKWKPNYDAHDSVRLAAGIHNYVVSRRYPDSNTVVVALRADNLDSAKAFINNPSLKSAMQKGGVTGTPDISYYKMVHDDNTTIATDMRTILRFTVKDWDAWKKSFESDRQLRLDNGLLERSYGYDANDNHKVMLVMAMTDTAKGNAFMKSDILKQKRDESGVVGKLDSKMIRITARY